MKDYAHTQKLCASHIYDMLRQISTFGFSSEMFTVAILSKMNTTTEINPLYYTTIASMHYYGLNFIDKEITTVLKIIDGMSERGIIVKQIYGGLPFKAPYRWESWSLLLEGRFGFI